MCVHKNLHGAQLLGHPVYICRKKLTILPCAVLVYSLVKDLVHRTAYMMPQHCDMFHIT